MHSLKNWRVFLFISILLLIITYLLSMAPYGYNTFTINNGNFSIEVSPINFTPIGNFFGLQSIKIIIINNGYENLSSSISYANHLLNLSLKPHSGTIQYIQPKSSFNLLYINITTLNYTKDITIKINFNSPLLTLLSEITMLFSFYFYYLFLKFYNSNFKLTWLIILLGYLILAPFFGQRYDMYFVLTSPLRIIKHINPFIGNEMMPGGLKWAYPPLFLIYGILFYTVLHYFGLNFDPSFTYLVTSGYEYSAWRGFYNTELPLLFFLEKLPLIISTFIIYWLFLKKFNFQYSKIELEKFWLLNPLIILIGTVWGQFDMLSLLSMILSIYFFLKNRTDLASIFATIGAFIKIFPVILIPYIILNSQRKIRDISYVILFSVISLIPYFIAGNFYMDLEVLIYSRSVPTVNGYFFANGMTWQILPLYLGIKNFPGIFPYILIPIYLTLLIMSKRLKISIIEFSLIFIISFFIFFNFVNPQYFIIPVALFILMRNKPYLILYSLIPILYVFLNYSFPYFVNYYYSYNYFSSTLGLGESFRLFFTNSAITLGTYVVICTIIYIMTLLAIIRDILSRNKSPDSILPS